MGWTNQDSNPTRENKFFSFSDMSSLQFNGFQVSCQAVNRPERDLTTHLHLVPGLRVSGAMPLLPLYASMAWSGETLLYNGSCPKFQT